MERTHYSRNHAQEGDPHGVLQALSHKLEVGGLPSIQYGIIKSLGELIRRHPFPGIVNPALVRLADHFHDTFVLPPQHFSLQSVFLSKQVKHVYDNIVTLFFRGSFPDATLRANNEYCSSSNVVRHHIWALLSRLNSENHSITNGYLSHHTVLNRERVIRAVSHVLFSSDTIARAITIRVLGELSGIIHTNGEPCTTVGAQSDAQQLVHHHVVRFLKSTHADERDAAVYAAKRLAKSSSEFSETVLDAIIPLVGSSATSSNISTHSKLQLLSIVPFLSLTFTTAQTVIQLCVDFAQSHPHHDDHIVALRILTKVARSLGNSLQLSFGQSNANGNPNTTSAVLFTINYLTIHGVTHPEQQVEVAAIDCLRVAIKCHLTGISDEIGDDLMGLNDCIETIFGILNSNATPENSNKRRAALRVVCSIAAQCPLRLFGATQSNDTIIKYDHRLDAVEGALSLGRPGEAPLCVSTISKLLLALIDAPGTAMTAKSLELLMRRLVQKICTSLFAQSSRCQLANNEEAAASVASFVRLLIHVSRRGTPLAAELIHCAWFRLLIRVSKITQIKPAQKLEPNHSTNVVLACILKDMPATVCYLPIDYVKQLALAFSSALGDGFLRAQVATSSQQDVVARICRFLLKLSRAFPEPKPVWYSSIMSTIKQVMQFSAAASLDWLVYSIARDALRWGHRQSDILHPCVPSPLLQVASRSQSDLNRLWLTALDSLSRLGRHSATQQLFSLANSASCKPQSLKSRNTTLFSFQIAYLNRLANYDRAAAQLVDLISGLRVSCRFISLSNALKNITSHCTTLREASTAVEALRREYFDLDTSSARALRETEQIGRLMAGTVEIFFSKFFSQESEHYNGIATELQQGRSIASILHLDGPSPVVQRHVDRIQQALTRSNGILQVEVSALATVVSALLEPLHSSQTLEIPKQFFYSYPHADRTTVELVVSPTGKNKGPVVIDSFGQSQQFVFTVTGVVKYGAAKATSRKVRGVVIIAQCQRLLETGFQPLQTIERQVQLAEGETSFSDSLFVHLPDYQNSMTVQIAVDLRLIDDEGLGDWVGPSTSVTLECK